MGRRGGGGWGWRGRGSRRKSLNAKYDNLMQSSCARPLELLAPSRVKNEVDSKREESRQALLERFGVKDSTTMVHSSSIDLPHLPRLQALDMVSHRKPRHKDEPVPEPPKWLVDIMYPDRAEPSQHPSLAVSPFEPHLQQENLPEVQQPQVQPHELIHPHPNGLHQPPPSLPSAYPQPLVAPQPQIPVQGPPWLTPGSTTAASSTASPYMPLWLTPHGVVDMAGRPLHLPSPFLSQSSLPRRRKRCSRYSRAGKRRRPHYASYSPDSEDSRYDSGLDIHYDHHRSDRHSSHYKRSRRERSAESRDHEVHESHRRERRKWNSDSRDVDACFLEEDRRVYTSHEDDFGRGDDWGGEDDGGRELHVKTGATRAASNPTPGDPGSNVSAHPAIAPTPTSASEPPNGEEDLEDFACDGFSPPPLGRPQHHFREDDDDTFLPTPPQTSSSATANGHLEERSGRRGVRLIKSLERAAEDMGDGDRVPMREDDWEDNSSPHETAAYPPTPAATQSTSIPSNGNASPLAEHSGSELTGKSPARMQRASERAWAALAALQPRHEQQDPVGAATPPPPSPALGPVDAQHSDEELVDDFEESESIYQFSDDGRYEEVVPQFDLEAEEAEESEDIEAAGMSPPPAPAQMPKSSFGAGSKAGPKRVRFAWDIGAVGDSDPGFKIWRDGY